MHISPKVFYNVEAKALVEKETVKIQKPEASEDKENSLPVP